ncbi:shikimate quinate [Musa troglodytarum]|uniref:Shikimate quinate n=1 Tax=Musa troglodytarum TaxID=320322 RepID=A0A9E7FNE6_9LILI|nr:shikimate quinate [Musa troglodytarum]
MAVQVTSSRLVTPDKETPTQAIWLSTLDLFQIRAHVATIYIYRPPATADRAGFFSPEALKAGLRKALVPFYLFAGRIGTDANGRTEIKCNGKGALFVEAKSDELTVDKFRDFAPSPEYRRMLVPSVSPDDGDDAVPLLLLQRTRTLFGCAVCTRTQTPVDGLLVKPIGGLAARSSLQLAEESIGNQPHDPNSLDVTYFKCGGVCLGFGVHHLVSDGVASLHFINAWSDITRGVDLAVPPVLDRTLLLPRSPPSVLFPHHEFKRYPAGRKASADKPAVSTATLELSADQLAALKTTCAKVASSRRVSTYEAVAGHVWRRACEARRLDAGRETRVYITTDGRRRLRPPLPPGYVGNVIFPTVAVATAGDVTSETTGHAASRIHGAITLVDDEYLRSALDFLEMEEDVKSLGRWAGNFTSADLSITCWTSLPIYEADFGWGLPEFTGPATMFYGGLCYVMPKPPAKAGGGVLVAVSLEAEFMDRFKELFYGTIAEN